MMFNLRRFVVPTTSSVIAVGSCSSSSSAAVLLNSMNFVGTNNNNNNRNRDNNYNNNNNRTRGGNNNNNNNNNRDFTRNFRDEHTIQQTPARLSSFTRNGEPYCDVTHAAENSNDGYRLTFAFPTTNCSFLDIQYSPQIRDKTPASENINEAEGKSDNKSGGGDAPRRQRLFGMPLIGLSVRMYPIQMAKVVAVLEGRTTEAVVTARLANGTFKRNNADGSIVYAVQNRDPTKVPEGGLTSAEVVIDPVNAYMLERFLNKMLVAGFDPSRDDAPKLRI